MLKPSYLQWRELLPKGEAANSQEEIYCSVFLASLELHLNIN